jgi:MFS family permease
MLWRGKLAVEPGADAGNVFVRLLPVLGAVFTIGTMLGAAIPVIPLYIHRDLGLGTVVVGFATGAQFAAAVLSRSWAGYYADRRGAKRVIVSGAALGVIAGAAYLLSQAFVETPAQAAIVLIAARLIQGFSESLIVTGSIAWGFSRIGHKNAGAIIAWVGNAAFGSMAIGAIVGTMLFAHGFGAVALATFLLPLGLLLALAKLPFAPPVTASQPTSLRKVASAVVLPGLGTACAAVGYATVLGFSALLFAQNRWEPVWLPFSAFAGAMIVSRICLGHLPDRIGGARVALISIPIECAGLLLIWLADTPAMAALGAVVAALGYTLVFPGYGREAVSRAPVESRGLAMGMFTAFPSTAMGFTGPVLGLMAASTGIAPVFAASGAVVLCSIAFAGRLIVSQGK